MSTEYFIKVWGKDDKCIETIYAIDHGVIDELERVSRKGPAKVTIYRAITLAEELVINNNCPIGGSSPPP